MVDICKKTVIKPLKLGLYHKNMKPLISYYGGKQNMVKHLLPLIPKHSIYVEPFAGGAALFFAKENPSSLTDSKYIEVLNDTNQDLINLYRVAKSRTEEFLKELGLIPYSEYLHREAKKNKADPCELKRAVNFYLRLMMSFSHNLDSGFAFSSKIPKQIYKYYFNYIDNADKCIERLKNVYIFDRDALNIIDLYDQSKTFFYCDPPYPNTDQGHYSGYAQKDFENLIEKLSNIKGSFILSCYENDAVPKDWEKFEFKTKNYSKCTIIGDSKSDRVECVWRKLSGYAKENQMSQMKMEFE